jgi:hypothetical protein
MSRSTVNQSNGWKDDIEKQQKFEKVLIREGENAHLRRNIQHTHGQLFVARGHQRHWKQNEIEK